MKPAFVLVCAMLVAACGPANPVSTTTATIAFPTATHSLATTTLTTSTPKPTDTLMMRVFTPVATNIPWDLPSGLNIEEHPLAKIPEIEPLVIHPLDGLTQAEVLQKHASLWVDNLPPNAYYSVGMGDLWVMQGNDRLEAAYGPGENGQETAQVTRNGMVIFSKLIIPPGVTSEYRVLDVYDNHWVLELAKEKSIPPNTQLVDSSFAGEIFLDGQSLNVIHGYEESYGFQTIHGKPFYFYKRDGKIEISYDGQEIALGYDGVSHYGCCSGGALNPRMAQSIIGFFAWRGTQWYYTEIGVFDHP
jgi:hypothetical protein